MLSLWRYNVTTKQATQGGFQMKKESHKDYVSVCSTVVGTSEFLLGDLSKLTKDITDVNKLTKRMRPSQSTGRGDMYRTLSHRTHRSFASRAEN